jgi:ubiquinone/menaquinone biosynthesis C-methylase UbiE
MIEMNSFLVCPNCRGDLARTAGSFGCANCGGLYPIIDGVPQFDLPVSRESGAAEGDRDVRRDYWDQGWEARFHGDHAFLANLRTRADWSAYLDQAIAEGRASQHVGVVEADEETVRDKVVLDIGCGSGTSGAVFGYRGAHYIGIDHSRHAASQGLRNLRGLGADGFTAQGNAEALPIRDNSIDVVYSNGVLHHTPNFLTSMDEAYRVLKPGGKGIIALYATYSTQFGIMRLMGVLKGNIGRRAMTRWMGEASEGAWRTGNKLNPWTQTFTKAQLRGVVRRYEVHGLVIRKYGNPIGEFPRYGNRLMQFGAIRALGRVLEPAFGGMLVVSFRKDLAAAHMRERNMAN